MTHQRHRSRRRRLCWCPSPGHLVYGLQYHGLLHRRLLSLPRRLGDGTSTIKSRVSVVCDGHVRLEPDHIVDDNRRSYRYAREKKKDRPSHPRSAPARHWSSSFLIIGLVLSVVTVALCYVYLSADFICRLDWACMECDRTIRSPSSSNGFLFHSRMNLKSPFDEAKDYILAEDTLESDFFCVSSPETCP